ncbi:hypothetical protein MMC13_000783 [Lambiella insularis]|nr:hypothetical protein [Lambiella insularis]
MSLWQSYLALSPRSRLYLGFGVLAWGGLGLLLTEQAEEKFDMVTTEKDREKLGEVMPKIHAVERDGTH